MSDAIRKIVTIPVLIVGDWVVDEHWVVGTHRAEASSRTVRDHTRALHKDNCSVRSLCGAGQVASVLHETEIVHKNTDSLASDQPVRPFCVFGAGIWAVGDDDILASMLEPSFNIDQTPHRLRGPEVDRTRQDPKRPRLFNFAQSVHPEGRTGTTRVIRIYQNTPTRLELKQRLDWAEALGARHRK